MKTLLSGIQPTGIPTLGNYLGAIKNFVELSKDSESYIFIADLHSITINLEPEELNKNIIKLAAFYIASGLSGDNVNLFVQSKNVNHAQLGWILITQTGLGELNRMTQFKDKKEKFKQDHIPAGLLTYPSLQAADIILYQPDIVPVGQDQKQHLELTKILSNRLNDRYDLDLKEPQAYIPQKTKKIMSLSNPLKKMSKSDPKKLATIFMDDDYETIVKKIKKAVTDMDGTVVYDVTNKPGVSNLMDIYSTITGKTHEEITNEFNGQNYGVFKAAVADAIWNEIEPIQNKYFRLLENQDEIKEILRQGNEKAFEKSNETLKKVQKSMGLGL